jgi:hypothetical protein
MNRYRLLSVFRLLLSIVVLGVGIQQTVQACACGCGVFEVSTTAMLPNREGGMLSLEYDHQSQDRNWRGSSPSSADNNGDKKILSEFLTLGYQQMLNRSWGFAVAIPYTQRYFKVADETSGDIMEFNHSSIGDVRLKGIYTGFSEDFSSGLTFGVKLPTGDFKYENFDPDVQIGSGSTDLLVGGYHVAPIAGSTEWNWFANAEIDLPVIHYSGYIPGSEVDAALGTYFNGWHLGPVKVAPTAQLLGTHRWSDSGDRAMAESTGFSRLLVAPGLELHAGPVRVSTDVGFPVYQYTTGEQLVASQFYKVNVGYHF